MANCRYCGQPMLPPGVEKKPNEYDHAQGCPGRENCAGYAFATPDGWVFQLTCGVTFTPGGSEVFYPGAPLTTNDPNEALTRRTHSGALRVLAKCAGLVTLVKLVERRGLVVTLRSRRRRQNSEAS